VVTFSRYTIEQATVPTMFQGFSAKCDQSTAVKTVLILTVIILFLHCFMLQFRQFTFKRHGTLLKLLSTIMRFSSLGLQNDSKIFWNQLAPWHNLYILMSSTGRNCLVANFEYVVQKCSKQYHKVKVQFGGVLKLND